MVEYTRVTILQTCGPSPRRLLYAQDLTYSVPPDELRWLLARQFAFREGDVRPLPPAKLAEQKKLAKAVEVQTLKREQAQTAKQAALEEANKKIKAKSEEKRRKREQLKRLAKIAELERELVE